MNKIVFNNEEFEVESYNKSTSFGGDTMTSSAYASLRVDDMASLNALAANPITSIKIYHDSTLIYNLTEISAKIDNINEYLSGDRMSINVNISFPNT